MLRLIVPTAEPSSQTFTVLSLTIRDTGLEEATGAALDGATRDSGLGGIMVDCNCNNSECSVAGGGGSV